MSELSDEGYASQTDIEREDSDMEGAGAAINDNDDTVNTWRTRRNNNANVLIITDGDTDDSASYIPPPPQQQQGDTDSSALNNICGAGAGAIPLPMDVDPDEDKKDISPSLSVDCFSTCPFLQLPTLVRESMYLFLSQKDMLSLRSVSLQLMTEVDHFADFTVNFRKSLGKDFVPIPFPHLKFLTVDNPHEDLPWYFDDPSVPSPPSVMTLALDWPQTPPLQLSDDNNNTGENPGPGQTNLTQVNRSKLEDSCQKSEDQCQCQASFQGTIGGVKLISIHPTTLHRLAHCRTIKEAIIATDIFERRIPALHWQNLTYLRLHFYIVRFVGTHELEMLENFDSMCGQTFPKLHTLKICLRRSYLNPQSSFSIRALRFMSRHWRTLRDMTIEMEAEKCDLYPQTQTPEFTREELENLGRVQLSSLKIDATELLCQKCRIWQDLIRQQTSLESLKVSIYAAHGHPVFFYPVDRHPSNTRMKTVSVGLWGLHGHFPIDFRRLTNGLDTIHNIRFFRSPTCLTETQDGPEILNLGQYTPQGLVSLTIKGFLVASEDVGILLKNTPELTHLTLKNAGCTTGMGMGIGHLQLLGEHPSLATACVDLSNPVGRSADESYELFLSRLVGGNNHCCKRWEFKVIGSRDNFHTFLFIDRERASALLRLKVKHHDDDVLPGLDYPMGFINRFDNWKIRS